MSVLKKPLITEKMTGLGDKLNQYGFLVDKKASKAQIKSEIEEVYNVKIASLNTMIYSGKAKSRYTKTGYVTGRNSAYKKAIFTLKDGQTLDFFENI